jgi:beta-phosphoglucomutase
MIKAVIFDLDGVLVKTDEYHYMAWKKIFKRIGLPFDRNLNNQLRGVSRLDSLNIVLEHSGLVISETEKELLVQEKNSYYVSYLQALDAGDLLPGAWEMLEALGNSGSKLAIGSSSKNAQTILGLTKIGRYFDAVSDGNNISRSKPDPEVFLTAADYLHEPYANCAVVEDAAAGIKAAHLAQMTAISYGSELEGTNLSDYHITRVSDLPVLLKKINSLVPIYL